MLTTQYIDIQAMLVWLTLPFYDFCGFWSVAVNTVYKLQFFTFMLDIGAVLKVRELGKISSRWIWRFCIAIIATMNSRKFGILEKRGLRILRFLAAKKLQPITALHYCIPTFTRFYNTQQNINCWYCFTVMLPVSLFLLLLIAYLIIRPLKHIA